MDQKNPNMRSAPSGNKKNTGMAVLAYIIFFIPLLTEAKDDPFVKYHIKQGLVLFILAVAGWIILRIIFPFVGWFLAPIFDLIILIYAVIGIINAIQGNEKQLPFIGKYADKFTF